MDSLLSALWEEGMERIIFCHYLLFIFLMPFFFNTQGNNQIILGSELNDLGYILNQLLLISCQTSVVKIKLIIFTFSVYS